ncbi:hypothetical protein HDU81_002421 [Chytriomyces hyalinus]|nr:hypothetical protein HDU81_002421 [Chytriomyces hyalinus]
MNSQPATHTFQPGPQASYYPAQSQLHPQEQLNPYQQHGLPPPGYYNPQIQHASQAQNNADFQAMYAPAGPWVYDYAKHPMMYNPNSQPQQLYAHPNAQMNGIYVSDESGKDGRLSDASYSTSVRASNHLFSPPANNQLNSLPASNFAPQKQEVTAELRNEYMPHFTYKNPDDPNLNEIILKMNLTMSVGTMNPNIYGLDVDAINLMANVVVNTTYIYNPLFTNPLSSFGALVRLTGSPRNAAGADSNYRPSNNSQIGTATHGKIYFPSKTWVNYTMIFEFVYTPDPVVGLLKDPTILELADVCGITSRYKPESANRTLRIHYLATSTIEILKPIGYAPQISNDLMIRCPFSKSQVDEVVEEVQSGMSSVGPSRFLLIFENVSRIEKCNSCVQYNVNAHRAVDTFIKNARNAVFDLDGVEAYLFWERGFERFQNEAFEPCFDIRSLWFTTIATFVLYHYFQLVYIRSLLLIIVAIIAAIYEAGQSVPSPTCQFQGNEILSAAK